jgi:hypothetical protein
MLLDRMRQAENRLGGRGVQAGLAISSSSKVRAVANAGSTLDEAGIRPQRTQQEFAGRRNADVLPERERQPEGVAMALAKKLGKPRAATMTRRGTLLSPDRECLGQAVLVRPKVVEWNRLRVDLLVG